MAKKLYRISFIAYHTYYIFQILIYYCQLFYIKKTKSLLLILYIVNYIFSTSNIL